MLFFITLFLLVIFVLISFAIKYIYKKYYSDEKLKGVKEFVWCHSEGLSFISILLSAIFSITFFTMAIVMCCNYIGSDTDMAINQETYKSLVYKAEAEAIRDEFGIVNKEYIDEIQNWNTDIVKYQTLTHNFWVGIFYPDWYDEFETIDLEKIKMEENQ